MGIRFEELTEGSTEAFLSVAASRFGEHVRVAVAKLLRNPNRTNGAGVVARTDDNLPVCVQGRIVRKAYLRQRPIFVVNGSMLAIREGFSPEVLLEVERRTFACESPAIVFSNTANRAAGRLQRLAIGVDYGPRQWSEVRSCHVRNTRVLWRRVFDKCRRMLGVRLKEFQLSSAADDWSVTSGTSTVIRVSALKNSGIDGFFTRYLMGNRGVVLSRTEKELDWAYGDKLAAGRAIFLLLREAESVVGYLCAVATDATCCTWKVHDLLVLGDDIVRMGGLLEVLKNYLRQRTPAVTLSVTGFPNSAQQLLSNHFPHVTALPHNVCLLKSDIPEAPAANLFDIGWFGSPYDGDYFL